MAHSEEELFAIVGRAAKAFAGLPNVHGVGLGGRERGGKPTGELVLKVLVFEKVPSDRLEPGARVPESFEGLPTDIIRVGRPRRLAAPPIGYKPGPDPPERDEARDRPLLGGTVISAQDDRAWGTMGLIVEVLEDDRKVFGITNYHVLFESAATETPGFLVGQPTPKASCTACCRGVIGKYAGGRRSVLVHDDPEAIDYALVQLDPGLEWLNEIKEIGVVEGTYNVRAADIVALDYQVSKRGAFTRVTGGTVQTIGIVAVPHTEPDILTDRLGYLQHYQDYSMLVRPNRDPAAPADPVIFTTHGDSGAAIVNGARQVVALLWGGEDEHTITGGDPATEHFGYAYCIPVNRIEADMNNRLGLTLTIHPTAGPGIVNTVPEFAGVESPVRAERGLERDLDRTEPGRVFLQAWLRHSDELNAIVQNQRRVATVWQRHNGAALLRLVARAPLEPAWPFPTEIDGVPVGEGLALFLSQIERYASDDLKRDLTAHRDLLLSLPGQTYQQVLGQLGGPMQ